MRGLTFWPIPTQDMTFRMYRWSPLLQFTDLTSIIGVPAGYLEAMKYNLALRRVFPIGDRLKLSLGLEAQSVFNHVNLYLPGNGNYTMFNAWSATAGFTLQSTFGQLSQANSQGDNRTVQLSIKMSF